MPNYSSYYLNEALEEDEEGIAAKMAGYLEPALTMASGIGGTIASGLGAPLDLLSGALMGTADPLQGTIDNINRTTEDMTYIPRTEEGMGALQGDW